MDKAAEGLRTWIEIDRKTLEHNLGVFLKSIPKRTRFMAVVKSNAYGHGLVQVAKLFTKLRIKNKESRLWFGVDSIVEGLRLRREGIKNPLLVLGSTLPSRMKEAAEKDIILTISNFESLKSLIRTNKRIVFHIKIDTGMHRQGFLPEQTPELIKLLKLNRLAPQGIYTHFASAKDATYPTYTREQFAKLKKIIGQFEKAGFRKLVRHAAASGGTLLFPETHLDMVRVGMSLYGYWPSLEAQISKRKERITLRPVLSWYTLVSEIKKIKRGSYIGYDLTERVNRASTIAILPIGYWHGYDRGLSNLGEVLVKGRRAKVLGRVCMDMVVIDITDIKGVKVGEKVTLIGKQNKEELWADELGLKTGTSQYEFLTRINPLIKRLVI